MKAKTYIASSVRLRRVPESHVASNGNRQFTILIRATSMKRIGEILGETMTLHHLTKFCGVQLAPTWVGYGNGGVQEVAAIVKKDETIYYAHGGKWHEYTKSAS